MKKCFIVLVIVLFCLLPSGNAQIIKGRITDINGAPILNSTIFVRELMLGTVANDEGFFEVRVPEGVYTCVFQCMGYETETVTISVGVSEVAEHNVALREISFVIPDLVVSNSREDPAYDMMRRAIAMAPYYLNQVSEYKAEVYLKGTLHVGRISPLMRRLARDEIAELNIREGNSYLEESFNEIEFTAPNMFRQRVVRKTGSLTGENSNSNNAMTLITASIYDEKAFDPIISPLSTSAFAHYRFRYEGFFFDDDRIINKIKIIPRRNSRQLFSGYVYIANDYWNVHSADVSGEFPMGITYSMQINFGEVNENVWKPVSYNFKFDASVLGNRGSFDYVASVKYTNLVENKSIRKPDALALAEQRRSFMQQNQVPPTELEERGVTVTRTSERIENLLERDNLTNRQAYQLARLMHREAEAENNENQSLDISATMNYNYRVTVDSAANQRDTAFWEMMRPVPLNSEEIRSYQERDIRLAAASQQRDTAQNTQNRNPQTPFIRTINKVVNGTNIRLGEQGGTIRYNGLNSSQIGFNTVDGFYIGQKLTYTKGFVPQYSYFAQQRLTVIPEAVWAINRKTLMWNVDASLTYSPVRRGSASLKFGQKTADFNGNSGIHPFENTVSSLFFRRNYMKHYEDNFVEASNVIDIVNGLQLNVGAKYTRRVMLDNHSDFSFFYRDTREYTSNIPSNTKLTTPLPDHVSATFSLNVDYTPRYYYRIVGIEKRYVRSDYPTFSVGWQKGVNGLMSSASNFDHISLGIRQKIETGLMQELRYAVNAGAFVNRESVFFPDFKHFNTVEIPFTIGSISSDSFNLLEYYRYSTSDRYLEAHLNYVSPFLFLKFLPFFSNRMLWKEGVQISYLYAPNMKNYIESGYTIGMSPLWEAGFFVGFENFKYRSLGVIASFNIR